MKSGNALTCFVYLHHLPNEPRIFKLLKNYIPDWLDTINIFDWCIAVDASERKAELMQF
jgi:hypothetical protein